MQSQSRKTYGSYKLLNMNKEGGKTSYLDSLRSRPLLDTSIVSVSSTESVTEKLPAESQQFAPDAPDARKETSSEVRKILNSQSTFSPFVRLSSMNLEDIPKEIGAFSKLQTIFLDNNKLTSLTYLDIRVNKISSLPSNFGSLCKLRDVLLFDNQIEDLPLSFGKLTELQNLKLFNNKLYKVPVAISMLRLLQELYLGNNLIDEVPEECFKGLHLLRRLDLSGNRISSLPQSMQMLSSLTIINLENNCFDRFPTVLFSLTRLVYISIHHNKLTSLPTGFSKLIFLLDLWLGNNELNFLPDEISSLPTLITLTVNDNPLYTDPVYQPLPEGRVRSLLEIASEQALKLDSIQQIIDSQVIPRDLAIYLQSSKLCTSCGGKRHH